MKPSLFETECCYDGDGNDLRYSHVGCENRPAPLDWSLRDVLREESKRRVVGTSIKKERDCRNNLHF